MRRHRFFLSKKRTKSPEREWFDGEAEPQRSEGNPGAGAIFFAKKWAKENGAGEWIQRCEGIVFFVKKKRTSTPLRERFDGEAEPQRSEGNPGAGAIFLQKNGQKKMAQGNGAACRHNDRQIQPSAAPFCSGYGNGK